MNDQTRAKFDQVEKVVAGALDTLREMQRTDDRERREDMTRARLAAVALVGDGTYAEFFERVVLDSPRGRELLRSWMCGNASSMVVASFDRGCEAAQKAKESKESKAKEAKKPVKVPKRVRDGLVALFTLQNGSTANAETVLDGAFAGMGVEVEG